MKIKFQAIILILTLLSSCASYEKFKLVTEETEIPQKVYKAEFNQTWQAVIQLMKKYDIAMQNQESGYIKTRWMDNTLQVNFTDSFGDNDAVKAAKFMLVVNVAKGFSAGKEVSKVTIFKRQLVEQDFLQGWKEVPTDGIQEQVFLYRLETLIKNDNSLREIDRAREKEQIENF
jgi:hypothetical protein